MKSYILLFLLFIWFNSIGQELENHTIDSVVNCHELDATSILELTNSNGEKLYPSFYTTDSEWSNNLSFRYVYDWSAFYSAEEILINERAFTGKLKVCNKLDIVVYSCDYENGKANGDFHIYNDQGKLITVGGFQEGKLHGEILSYHPITGILDTKLNYDSNILDGLTIRNYENGDPYSIIDYEQGKAVRGINYFKSGQVKHEWYILSDTEDEVFTYYHENGNRKKTGIKRMPIDGPPTMQGEWTWFNEDGTMIKSKDCSDIVLECDGWDCDDFDNAIMRE